MYACREAHWKGGGKKERGEKGERNEKEGGRKGKEVGGREE